jgi:hypothetical protein
VQLYQSARLQIDEDTATGDRTEALHQPAVRGIAAKIK